MAKAVALGEVVAVSVRVFIAVPVSTPCGDGGESEVVWVGGASSDEGRWWAGGRAA